MWVVPYNTRVGPTARAPLVRYLPLDVLSRLTIIRLQSILAPNSIAIKISFTLEVLCSVTYGPLCDIFCGTLISALCRLARALFSQLQDTRLQEDCCASTSC
ncbi:unnamed protein product, partial [Iphiclides podalirius]